jgi:hypothetical protein
MATISCIAPSVDDQLMEELLRVFGPIKSWRRPRDPKTDTPKTFGFIDYENPESMNLALRVCLCCRCCGDVKLWVDKADNLLRPVTLLTTPGSFYSESTQQIELVSSRLIMSHALLVKAAS